MQVDVLVHNVPADGMWDGKALGSPCGYAGDGHPEEAARLPLRPGSPADNPDSVRVVVAGL